jgi:signal transduction histidine kinase
MRQRWGPRRVSITARLRIVFAVVIVLMLSGSIVSFWHFRNVTTYANRMSTAERRLTVVLRLNNNLLILMSKLHRTADKENSTEFKAESSHLLNLFATRSQNIVGALEEIADEDDRYAVLIGSILGLLDGLPKRVLSLTELADRGDWMVVHARLLNQADETDDVVAALMNRLDEDLVDARKRLTEDLASARDRAVSTIAVTAVLSLAIAVLLGAVVTESLRNPLSKLNRGTRALAAGNFAHRIPEDGHDELTELARAFNQTAAELERLFADVRRERTIAESARAELQERARELARANADLQQFAYSASHDLQEPLRTITLYSQLLQRRWARRLDPGADECIDFVSKAAQHMQQLISDLLAYTRAGVEGAVETPADVNAVLERVLSILRVPIKEQNCKVKVVGTLPPVRVLEIHVQQILQNLITNAIKYRSEERDPEIEIWAERKDGMWELAVRDNGLGIESQYSKQIFGMFKRLHGQRYSGTGIGLAICQRIVEGYGGEIWVESVPGHSSTFRLTLPAA